MRRAVVTLSSIASCVAVIALVSCAVSCAPSYKVGPNDTIFQRAAPPTLHRLIRTSAEVTDWWDEVLHSIVVPLTRIASPAVIIGWASGGPRALDVNEFEQVPDSLWFENRINRGRVSTRALAEGPAASLGPAAGPLLIISGKLQGVSPGFVVRDSAGVIFFVKFDPPSFPSLASGAEIIATRLLHAAGFHVPDNFLVDLDLGRLVLDTGARTRDDYNRNVPLTKDDLDQLLLQLNPSPKGTLRALFSRSVPGVPLGPFRYRGVRQGDPNDTIAHERRRSLRGYWLFAAWLNNVDVRQQNTLDTFIEEPGRGGLGAIKHYLIDFGASLGSNSVSEKHSAQGYERRLDWTEIGLRLITFGFRDPLWFSVSRSPFREIGIFESEVFDPALWSPTYTNQAFNAADADDTLWAASILAHFSYDDIKAAVSAAQYREPKAAEWVTRVLFARRNKLLRHAFSKRAPLDLPRVHAGLLRLTDLVVLAQMTAPAAVYEFAVLWQRTRQSDRAVDIFTRGQPELDLGPIIASSRERFGAAFDADPYLRVTARRVIGEERGRPVDIVVRVDGDLAFPVALRRR